MNFLKKIFKGVEFTIEFLVFASRWWQVPIYVGLVVGSVLYTYKFMMELWTLAVNAQEYTEIQAMLSILVLIDISMVMNLLVIVIIGGYSIFTSKIDFSHTEDRPQWLDNLDADRLKVKLASSLASISGVHLLKSFIDIHSEQKDGTVSLDYEIYIHMVFIISSLILAWIARALDPDRESPKAESRNESLS